MMKRLLVAIVVTVMAVVPQPALAVFDPNKVNYEVGNDVIFRDDAHEQGDLLCSEGVLPPTTAVLNESELGRIEALKSTYIQAESQTEIRWEVFAALDYRENNNDPNKSMLGGEPIGEAAVDSGYVPTTKLDSIIRGSQIFIGNAKAFYNVDVLAPMTSEQIAQAFLAYNRGNRYVTAGLSYDVSPYVMNFYDEEHQNMIWPNDPIAEQFAPIRGQPDSRMGALAVFAVLVPDLVGCAGGIGDPVDYTGLVGVYEPGTLPDELLCTPRPEEPAFRLLDGPACVSFLELDRAYTEQFGNPMPLSPGGGYRTKEVQVACGGTKQSPGGFNPNCIYYDPDTPPPEHLWGTAIDFSGPLSNSSTAEHQWLVANGPTMGWFWPPWGRTGGGNAGNAEPWHFGYYFVGHDPNRSSLEKLK